MKELLNHPWFKVLLIATTVAMVSMALRETASITMPIITAVYEVLVPVAIAFVIAYVLTPLVDVISRKAGTGRAIATSVIFLGVIGLALLTVIMALPPLIRQSTLLVQQAVRGEAYTDANRNNEFDLGESFDDVNRNGVRDGPFLSCLLSWAENRQNRLQRLINAAPNEEGIAVAFAYKGERARLISALSATEAQRAGSATRAADARLIPALRTLRGQSVPDADQALIENLRAQTSITDEGQRAVALQYVQTLDNEEKNGSHDASEILNLIPLGETASSKAMAGYKSKVEDGLRSWLDGLPERVASWAGSASRSFGQLISIAIDVMLVPIYAFFLILAMPVLRARVKACIPLRHRVQTLGIVHQIERAVAAFFRGRLIICGACAALGVVGFLVISALGVHTPYGILFGIAIGLATAIPLASFILLLPALLLTWMQPGATGVDLALVTLVYALVQGLEAVLIPAVMGREVELHPVVLIIALLLCGKLLGILGLILAVPIAATARILARVYVWPWLATWTAKGMDAVQPPRPPTEPPATIP